MKYFSRANIYKNSTGSNKYNVEAREAYSYDWWLYFKDYDGLMVFNNYYYSSSTRKHQSDLRGLLIDLGYDLDKMWFLECPKGLQDPDSGIEHYQYLIHQLLFKINKKGTRKAKNLERKAEIELYKTKIEQLQKLKQIQAGE